jgi:hypothetical protein
MFVWWWIGGGWCVNLFYWSHLVKTRPLAFDFEWDQAKQKAENKQKVFEIQERTNVKRVIIV